MLKKRYFFLTYLITVIPVLFVSIFASGVIFQEMLKLEDEMLQRQLVNVKEMLIGKYLNYHDEGIVIGSRTELLPYKMLGHPKNADAGIDLLKMKKNFDDDIIDVFLTFETENVYSSNGISRKSVYFGSTLNCDEQSIRRACEIVENDKNTVALLYDKKAGGNILFSYKLQRPFSSSTSVNFVMDFEKLNDIFRISNENQYCELMLQDGTSIVLGSEADGKTIIYSQDEWGAFTDKVQLACFEEEIDELGMRIRMYYGENDVLEGQWIHKTQMVNVVLIFVGISWAVLFSWFYSRKQLREIVLLESIAKGEEERALSSKNIYYNLQSLIMQGICYNRKLEENIVYQKEELRDNIISLIFRGGIYNETYNLKLFKELGIDRIPEQYFVGAVSADAVLSKELVQSVFTEEIWMPIDYEKRSIVLYLCEIRMHDENQMQRKKMAEVIRHRLHQKGIGKVRIGMSQIYSNLSLADCAYMEAIQMLKRILDGKELDYYICYDGCKEEVHVMLSDEDLLQEFEAAMREQDYEKSIQTFHQLLHTSMAGECTKQNRYYLRFEILQEIVQYLNEDKSIYKTSLIKECLNINVEHEREFINSVTNILQKCLCKREGDSFTKMLEYIDGNYQNSELTFEEVAAAGGISRNYISKIFKGRLGMSYIEYLTRVRLDKACILLRTSDVNINVVAEMVGYASAASFRRAFKLKYGISASDYRNKERKYRENN